MNNEQSAMQHFQLLFFLYNGDYDRNFWPDAKYKFFGRSIPFGAEHLSSIHESSDAEISRIFKQIILFSQYK